MTTPNDRIIRSPRGPEKTARTWAAEAAVSYTHLTLPTTPYV